MLRLRHEVLRLEAQTSDKHLCRLILQPVVISFCHQVSRFLLEILNILFFDSLNELAEQELLELFKMALVGGREGLALRGETALILNLELLAALFKPFLDFALHVKNFLFHA